MMQHQDNREDVAQALDTMAEVGFSSRLRVLADILEQCGSDSQHVAAAIEGMSEEDRTLLQDVLLKTSSLSARLDDAIESSEALLQETQRKGTSREPAAVDVGRFLPYQSRSPEKIDRENILLVTKDSKIQYDMKRWNLSTVEEVVAIYKEGEEDVQRIVDSHNRQQESLKKLQAVFPDSQFIGRDEISDEAFSKASLVVSVGGDNHFQWVADHVRDDTPVLGLNSDPKSSTGALLPFDTDSFLKFLPDLESAQYRFSPWTRIEATLDGKLLGPISCDVFIGQKNRELMSRHVLKIGNDQLEQKSSGMLISNGAGSTGWYNNAIRALYPRGHSFSPESPYVRYLLTEVSGSVSDSQLLELPPYSEGVLYPGETMEIHSLNREGGIISIDSLFREPFERGSVLEIRIAPQPLWRIESAHADSVDS